MTRVLLVRLSAMGDLVQSLGAVTALADARPDLELWLATQAPFVPLARAARGLAGIVDHDRRGGVRAFVATARRLRALRCGTAIDLQGNWKSAALVRLSGARERIGAMAPWRQEPASGWLLNRRVRVDGAPHPAEVAMALVRTLAPAVAFARPQLAATATAMAHVAAQLRAVGVDAQWPFRVVSVGAPGDVRSQAAAALARELAATDLPAVAVLGPGEQRAELPAGCRVLRQQAGRVDELVALGALLARCAGEAVGPDHGPMHVLTAAGARTRVLFGPQDPIRTAPPGAVVLQHPQPPTCMPCRRRTCTNEEGPVCMQFASAEGVRVGDAPTRASELGP